MATAVGDLVATLGMNVAPFQSAMQTAQQKVVQFSGSMGGILSTITAPFSRMLDTIKEAFNQFTNLVNPVNWLGKAFQGLMYPLQFCMRELESAFDPSRAIQNFVKMEQTVVRLQQVLKNTGGKAGTFEELEAMAGGKHQRLAAMMPLVQVGLGGDAFKDAFAVSKNLSAIMGGDLSNASGLLARSMARPENAARMLRQAYITIPPALRETIKAFVEAGQVEDAQAVLLNHISKVSAGMAEQMSGTLGKQMQLFKMEIEKLSESFGAALAPVMREVIDMFKALAEWLSSNSGTMKEWGEIAANAFRSVTQPVRDLFKLLKEDGSEAWLYLQYTWSRLQDAFSDGVTYLKRLFNNLWLYLKEVFRELSAYISAVLREALANVMIDMPSMVGGGEKWKRKAAGARIQQELHSETLGLLAQGKFPYKTPEGFMPWENLNKGLGVPSAATKALQDKVQPMLDAIKEKELAGKGNWEATAQSMAQRAAESMTRVPGKPAEPEKPAELSKAMQYGSQDAWKAIMDNMYGLDKEKDKHQKKIADNSDKTVGLLGDIKDELGGEEMAIP